jgi:hypothetical protein
MMKIALAIAFAVALLGALPAHASGPQGEYHRTKPQFCRISDPTSVPEPSSFLMLGSGLLTLAGIGTLRRHTSR